MTASYGINRTFSPDPLEKSEICSEEDSDSTDNEEEKEGKSVSNSLVGGDKSEVQDQSFLARVQVEEESKDPPSES